MIKEVNSIKGISTIIGKITGIITGIITGMIIGIIKWATKIITMVTRIHRRLGFNRNNILNPKIIGRMSLYILNLLKKIMVLVPCKARVD